LIEISTSSGNSAKNRIFPPLRVQSRAWKKALSLGTAKRVVSTPIPSVREKTFCCKSASRASKAASAPTASAFSIRLGMRSVAIAFAPKYFTNIMNISPIGPAPVTKTLCPGLTCAFFTALRQQLVGSTKLACSKLTRSGIRINPPLRTICPGTLTYSAKPPPLGVNPAVVVMFL
jgi:hypothetical protein